MDAVIMFLSALEERGVRVQDPCPLLDKCYTIGP